MIWICSVPSSASRKLGRLRFSNMFESNRLHLDGHSQVLQRAFAGQPVEPLDRRM